MALSIGEYIYDIFRGKWLIGNLIGRGGFGFIYKTSGNNVIKSEQITSVNPLDTESAFYRTIKEKDKQNFCKIMGINHLGIPKYTIKGESEDKTKQFIVIQYIGTSLDKRLADCGNKFSLKTVLQLTNQLLYILEFLHLHNYSYGDLKSSNIMTDDINPENVYLTDFGQCKMYCSSKGIHVKEENKSTVDGTIEFVSRDAHNGNIVSRTGDLENLLYLIVRWLDGTLPWMSNLNNAFKMKKDFIKDYKSMHSFVNELLTEIKKNSYTDNPNYAKLRIALLTCADENKITLNNKWDWII